MDLPASVAALGEQLRAGYNLVPDTALFCDANVFAAERERIFGRPLMAVDHVSRLTGDHYFGCDAAPRSIILVCDEGGNLRALRNLCLHAGYPICDGEDGAGERLICPYHGWEYSLDGRLVEPELSARIDPARLRLASYPVHVRKGLIFVDFSGNADAVDGSTDAVPAWLTDATVVRRTRYNTTWNWKLLHILLRSSPHLFCDNQPDAQIEFGPLSFMMTRSNRAVLLRVIPRFAEQTELQVIEMTAQDGPAEADGADRTDLLAEELRRADPSAAWFDHRFAGWYWSLMSAA
jgi:nitrite reductase/ring-hydroxylating ferredoxin subunit